MLAQHSSAVLRPWACQHGAPCSLGCTPLGFTPAPPPPIPHNHALRRSPVTGFAPGCVLGSVVVMRPDGGPFTLEHWSALDATIDGAGAWGGWKGVGRALNVMVPAALHSRRSSPHRPPARLPTYFSPPAHPRTAPAHLPTRFTSPCAHITSPWCRHHAMAAVCILGELGMGDTVSEGMLQDACEELEWRLSEEGRADAVAAAAAAGAPSPAAKQVPACGGGSGKGPQGDRQVGAEGSTGLACASPAPTSSEGADTVPFDQSRGCAPLPSVPPSEAQPPPQQQQQQQRQCSASHPLVADDDGDGGSMPARGPGCSWFGWGSSGSGWGGSFPAAPTPISLITKHSRRRGGGWPQHSARRRGALGWRKRMAAQQAVSEMAMDMGGDGSEGTG